MELYQIPPNQFLHETLPGINENFTKIAAEISKLGKGVYGFTYDVTAATPDRVRIGDMACHASLPVENEIKRCLQADDFTINYFCDENNSNLREDGSPALLDGTDGQFMVRIPAHYVRHTREGNWQTYLHSKFAFEGARFVPEMFISATEAVMDRTNNKLAAVVSEDAQYRGGDNQAAWDATPQTQLGKPVTNQSLDQFNALAANRAAGWYAGQYEPAKVLYWMMTNEYATSYHQREFTETLTPEGYKQGGMGPGMTDISSAEWSSFSSYNPLVEVGRTASLGNKTGVIPVTLTDFPTAAESRNTQIFSYRGVENFFGNIWELTDGVRFRYTAGVGHIYRATRPGVSNNNLMGYKYLGKLPNNGYISEIIGGEEGDILPLKTSGASATTHITDYLWNSSGDGDRVLLRGANATNGSQAGSAASHTNTASSTAYATFGSRLCNFGKP